MQIFERVNTAPYKKEFRMKQHMKIAIQGGQASFHDMATRQYFAGHPVELLECMTFGRLCDALANREVDAAVMAIENTLAGSILPNYSLLERYNFHIIGETYLHIQQNLMALPGQRIEDIETVRSHPMALHQCSVFLEAHPHLRAIESFDTAESAREIRQNNLRGVAAIASKMAANRYQLQILAEEIENLKKNYTRFLILLNKEYRNGTPPDKASISFRVSHEVGSLVSVLQIFREHGLNLSLIQSIPIPGQPSEYAFHIDLLWQNETDFHRGIAAASPFARGIKILGIYKSGVIPYDHSVRQPAFSG